MIRIHKYKNNGLEYNKVLVFMNYISQEALILICTCTIKSINKTMRGHF